jgi:WD40 repeat protein
MFRSTAQFDEDESLEPLDAVDFGTPFWSVAYSPDGSKLATAESEAVRLWDPENGKKLAEVKREGVHNRSACVPPSAVFSADGRFLVTAGAAGHVGFACVWSVAPLKPVGSYGKQADTVSDVAVASKGRLLATSWLNGSVRVRNLKTRKLLHEFLRNRNEAQASVAFSPDGKILAAGSYNGRVRTWSMGSGKQGLETGNCGHAVACIAFSPDGETLAVGGQAVRILDAKTGRQLQRFRTLGRNWVKTLAYSPDGKLIASGGGNRILYIWEAGTGKLLRQIEGHKSWISKLCFSPDGSKVVSVSEDATLKIWNVANGNLVRTIRSPGAKRVSDDTKATRPEATP